MSRVSSDPPRKIVRLWIGRLLIAAVVVECVVLGAIHLRRWIGNDDRIGASGASEPDEESLAGPSPSPPAPSPQVAQTRGPGAMGEHPQSTEGRSDPDGDGRMGTQAAGDIRRSESNQTAPVGDDPRTVADVGPVGGTGSSGGMDPTKDPAGAANVAGPGMNARPLTAPAGAPPGGSSTPSSSRPGSSGGAVGPSVSLPVPGMPVAEGDAGSSGDPKPDEDTQEEHDKSDEDDSGGDDSGADSTPPVLESLRFDPPQIEGGNVTTLTVQASDARSGLKTMWGEIRSPNRSAALSFGSGNVSGGTVFSFPISLPRAAQTGTWYVAWLSLTDQAGNTKLIQAASASAAPPGGTFAAFSSESDATPPEVLQVWFDRSAVGPGEKNTIAVEARDDRSGVASVIGACQSPSKSALIWFSGALNADSGTWVGEVSIPKTADCGEWVVQQLAVKDKAGNTTLLQANSPPLARAGFRVASGSDCDFTAPTLDAFDLSPAIVLSGTATEILVTARVYDEGSGAATMTGWFEGPAPAGGQSPKNPLSCSPDPRDPDAPWTCRIQVPQLAAKGTWKVGAIRLEDKAKNVRTYTSADPVVSGRVFQVQ